MTDDKTTPPTSAPEPTAKSGSPTWMKVALGVSLALNLAVVGTVVGFAIRAHGDDFGRSPPVRELSFGPFSDALTKSQRRELLRGFFEKGPRSQRIGDQIRAEYDGVVTALKTQPFDRAVLDQAVGEQSQKMGERLDAGRKALVDLVAAMSPQERADFAHRLEEALERGSHFKR